MSNYAISLKRSTALLAALTFAATLTVVNIASIFSNSVGAAQLSARSLTLTSTLAGDETSGAANSETNGSDAAHTVGFTTGATGSSAVAVRLLYCTAAIGTCTTPTGLVTTSATVQGQTGVSGLVVDSVAVNGTIDLDTGTFGNSTASTISMENITNPTSVGTFFVRITTYSDNFTTEVDYGTVASSITEGIQITARVAETLGFSTTGSFAGVGDPGTACDPVTGSGAITLGDPTETTLAITQAYDNYSAFRIYTNAVNGVSINFEGDTLRHSNTTDTITALASETAADFGVEQFGLGVDVVNGTNAAVAIASSASTLDMTHVDQAADFGGAGQIAISTDYDGGAGTMLDAGAGTALFNYAVDTVTEIADSSSYVLCNTAAVRYMANIAPTTAAGTYTTTIVYSAVPQY